MMNLFNLFKKKEPPRQGGVINAVNALSDAMQKFADNFMYGVPVSKNPDSKSHTDQNFINIFILKQPCSDMSRKEIDKVKEICNALCTSLKPVYSWVTENATETISMLQSAEIVVNIDNYTCDTSLTSAAHITAKTLRKKIVNINDLEAALKHIKLFNR